MELILFLCLLLKHAIVDIGIQAYQPNLSKATYTSLRAHYHYAPHGAGTFLAFAIFVDPVTALIAGAIDWIAHWHIDFVKSSVVKHGNLEKYKPKWFWATTVDQMLHYATYYLLVTNFS